MLIWISKKAFSVHIGIYIFYIQQHILNSEKSQQRTAQQLSLIWLYSRCVFVYSNSNKYLSKLTIIWPWNKRLLNDTQRLYVNQRLSTTIIIQFKEIVVYCSTAAVNANAWKEHYL